MFFFYMFHRQLKPPVNAADAAILACSIAARQMGAEVIVVLTVSGATAIQLSRVAPEALILTVSTNHMVARQLQLYRGIIPIIYDSKAHFYLLLPTNK
jgi:pyruvate kinase